MGYGDGCIYYNTQKKKWLAQLNMGKDLDGKIIRKTVSGNTRNEARRKLNELQYQKYTGQFVMANGMTFKELVLSVLDESLALNEFQIQTYSRYLATLKMCNSINNIPIQKIDSTIIQQFLISLVDRYAQTTIKKIWIMLHLCFKNAVKRKIIIDNPMDNVRKPNSRKRTSKIRALTIEEQRRLYRVMTEEHCIYSSQILISMLTGMRMGEINALYVSDVNLNLNYINIDKTVAVDIQGIPFLNDTPKTKTGERRIPINDIVRPLFEKLLASKEHSKNEMLFYSKKGTLVPTSLVNDEFKLMLEKYDIVDESIKGNVTVHSLRHTYATRCVEAGASPKVLQKLLGHANIKVTLDTYTDVFESFQTESVQKVDNYLKDLGLKYNAS